jgi:putative ABC transport system permease protein
MQTLWQSLEEKPVLTDANIRSMRQYIANKFPAYSSASCADILANSVHRHINDYLPAVDDLLKEQIRAHLLQTAYKQRSFRIGLLDISKACVALSSGKREILEPLEQWLKLHGDHITAEQTANFIQQIQDELGLKSTNQNMHAELAVKPQVKWFERIKLHQTLTSNAAMIMITLLLFVAFHTHPWMPYQTGFTSYYSIPESLVMDEVVSKAFIQRVYPEMMTIHSPVNDLTERYSYHDVPLEAIRQWLINKDSVLAKEPYLSTIIETAHLYNIHPFLLFAIAGQEQALVPNTNSKASVIANNPFNVYHSWKEYNTDIADSSRIAARTITSLAEGRPEGTHPLEWINRKYAEDPKWHVGVEAYFKQMLVQINPSSFKADS